jgi:hypothetical protein
MLIYISLLINWLRPPRLAKVELRARLEIAFLAVIPEFSAAKLAKNARQAFQVALSFC